MIRVKLSTDFPEWPLIRQTPGRAGVWGDCRFFINEEVEECDFWVVYNDVLRPETTCCPPGNTLLITGEPPSVKTYHPRFVAQFAKVLTCQRELKHRQIIYGQQAQPWMVGGRYQREAKTWAKAYTRDYDELSSLPPVLKTKRLSVIASDKAFTPGHRQRLEFVEYLRQHFGNTLDVYGRGIRDVEDKWDAIAPYQYHVVIENCQYADYWTEKLTDTILAGAYPFYAGCPNIGDYFSTDVLTPLNLTDPEAAVATIVASLAEDRFESTVTSRQEAKQIVLNRYNLFPTLEKMIGTQFSILSPKKLQFYPEARFSRTLASKVKHRVLKLWR